MPACFLYLHPHKHIYIHPASRRHRCWSRRHESWEGIHAVYSSITPAIGPGDSLRLQARIVTSTNYSSITLRWQSTPQLAPNQQLTLLQWVNVQRVFCPAHHSHTMFYISWQMLLEWHKHMGHVVRGGIKYVGVHIKSLSVLIVAVVY